MTNWHMTNSHITNAHMTNPEAKVLSGSMDFYALSVLEFDEVLRCVPTRVGSSLGKARVLEARPFDGADQAHQAQQRTRELIEHAASGHRLPLHGVSDIRVQMGALQREGRPKDALDLVRIGRFLAALESLRTHVFQGLTEMPACCELAERIEPLPSIVDTLELALDARGQVLDGASPRLASYRQEIRDVDGQIHRVLRQVLSRAEVRRALQDDRVHWRDSRPVLALKREQRGTVRGLVHDYSQSGATAFVEPDEVLELGNHLTTLRSRERQEINRLLVEWTRMILADRLAIEANVRHVMDLELSWIAADVARAGWTVPDMPDEALLDLRAARHPLLEAELETRREAGEEGDDLVPLDLHLGDAFDMLVITGPNTGGKTVAMKTAGICALLAASGLPIPAEAGSRVPYYGAVFADIGDEQAIAQSLSTFSSHLKRIQWALSHAGRGSLVLLDELGAGTDPAEGAALGYALLETLLARRVPTIASTHLGALKVFAYRNARAENASVEFDAESLRPLYRLQIGLPGESNALKIARRLGLSGDILNLAAAKLEGHDQGLSEVIEEVRQVRSDAEQSRHRAKEMEARSERQLEEAQEKNRAAEERSVALSAEADRVVEESFRTVQREVDAMIGHLPSMPQGVRGEIEEGVMRILAALESTSLGAKREQFIKKLNAGDWVYVPKFRQRCVVRRVDHKREEIHVQVGAIAMQLGFAEVTWYETL